MGTARIPRAPSREYSAAGRPEFGAPPIELHNDDDLIAACVAQGGFPTARVLRCGRTVWADMAGLYWRHRG